MNKAITDGLVLMPPPFAAGLGQWSSENGTAGSATYAAAANAALVPADQDFGGCLELLKTQTTQKLRYMGQTPILPGCYLRVTARVKAVTGNFMAVRIAGWAGGAGDINVAGVPQTGASVTLNTYGQVVTVSAIIGSGSRTGVDLVWGTQPIYGHFGIDLTGANGGSIRIDDIQIEDVTSVFHRVMMDWVDVRDYGAIGNGIADDTAAFLAADAAAAGRTVLISKGTYFLGDNVTLNAQVRCEGTVIVPATKRFTLTRNFDLATYSLAFGDELTGFRRALQALFYFTDHVTLDMCGRRLEINAPIDVFALANNLTVSSVRRTIRNGQFNLDASTAWDTATATSQATYSASNPLTLTGVTNIASIAPGSLVSGSGVGREVYVRAVNVGAGSLTLSQPLYGAVGTQSYTFKRFKYLFDFSGFTALDKIEMNDIEFLCNGVASAVMLAPIGSAMRFADCVFNKPKDRAITSIGSGCQDLIVDQCQFLSNEQSVRVQDRTTIALNINANDAKIRNNRAARWAHFAVMAGNGHLILGNHYYLGDNETAGVRRAGLILTEPNLKVTINGNYIDNNFLELSNEHDASPAFGSEFSFGGLTVTGNIFTVNDVAPSFRWIVIAPKGAGHFIQGLTITNNVFKVLNGSIDRVDAVDTSVASLDFLRTRNLNVTGNTFTGVDQMMVSPVMLEHEQVTAAASWTIDTAGFLPFGTYARNVQSLVAEGTITGAASERRTDMPSVNVEQGGSKQQIKLNWAQPSKGKVHVTVRGDNPN